MFVEDAETTENNASRRLLAHEIRREVGSKCLVKDP